MSPAVLHRIACAALLTLIAWLVAWELWLAPLRPGGSWLVLKVVPLLLPLIGVLKARIYTLQWAVLLSFIYFTEGIVRATSDQGRSSAMALGEVLLVLVFTGAAVAYLRPFKRAAKAKQTASISTISST